LNVLNDHLCDTETSLSSVWVADYGGFINPIQIQFLDGISSLQVAVKKYSEIAGIFNV